MRVNEKILEEITEIRQELSRVRQMVSPPLRGLVSEKEAAVYLDISVKVLREGITITGHTQPLAISPRYVGSRKLYSIKELDELIEQLPRIHPRKRKSK